MRVRELLRNKQQAVTVTAGTKVREAARLLMRHGIGGVPVLSANGRLAGFVSERDIVRALDKGGDDIPGLVVERVMQTPAPVCDADATLREVMRDMTSERHRHVVVTEGGRIAGVISVGDLVKHRLEQLETEAGVLRDYVAAQRASS